MALGAPEESAWSDWVKPVLFACLREQVEPVPRELGESGAMSRAAALVTSPSWSTCPVPTESCSVWRSRTSATARCRCTTPCRMPARSSTCDPREASVGKRRDAAARAAAHRAARLLARRVAPGGSVGVLSSRALRQPLGRAPYRLSVAEQAERCRHPSRAAHPFDLGAPSARLGGGLAGVAATRDRALATRYQRLAVAAAVPVEPRRWYVRVWTWLISRSRLRRGNGTYGRFWAQGG